MKKTTLFRFAFALANPAEFSRSYAPTISEWTPKIQFRDKQSRSNFRDAIDQKEIQNVPNPITVILGCRGYGKTRLAKIIAESWGEDEAMVITSVGMLRQQSHRSSTLIFDNITYKDIKESERMLLSISSGVPILTRPQGKQEIQSHKPAKVIITANGDDFMVCAHLLARMRVIVLAPPLISARVPGSGKTKLATAAA